MRYLVFALALLTLPACSGWDAEPADTSHRLTAHNRTPGRIARGYLGPVRSFPGAEIPFEFVDDKNASVAIADAESSDPDVATVERIDAGIVWVRTHAQGHVELSVLVETGARRTIAFDVNRVASQTIEPVHAHRFGDGVAPAALLGGGSVELVPRFRGPSGNDLTGVYDDIWTYSGEGTLSDPPDSDVATYTAADATGIASFKTFGAQGEFPVVPSADVAWVGLSVDPTNTYVASDCGAPPGQEISATEIQGFVRLGTATHEVWGEPADEISIEVSGGAVLTRASPTSRRFRINNLAAGPLEVTTSWRGMTSTRHFVVCAPAPKQR